MPIIPTLGVSKETSIIRGMWCEFDQICNFASISNELKYFENHLTEVSFPAKYSIITKYYLKPEIETVLHGKVHIDLILNIHCLKMNKRSCIVITPKTVRQNDEYKNLRRGENGS